MNTMEMFQNFGLGFLALREPAKRDLSSQLIYRGNLVLDPHSDLEVIYHFLKPGSLLVMSYSGGQIILTYKGFRLGFLDVSHSTDLQRMLQHPHLYKATITNISKNKFLPPDTIQIEIHKNF